MRFMHIPLYILQKLLDHRGDRLQVLCRRLVLLVHEELLELFYRYQLVVARVRKPPAKDLVDRIRRHHQLFVEPRETVEADLVALLHVHLREDLHQLRGADLAVQLGEERLQVLLGDRIVTVLHRVELFAQPPLHRIGVRGGVHHLAHVTKASDPHVALLWREGDDGEGAKFELGAVENDEAGVRIGTFVVVGPFVKVLGILSRADLVYFADLKASFEGVSALRFIARLEGRMGN